MADTMQLIVYPKEAAIRNISMDYVATIGYFPVRFDQLDTECTAPLIID